MRLLAAVFVSLCFSAFTDLTAHAQDQYPSKVVKIVVPYGPGGTTDIVARVLADELKNSLGQPFVVENKPGADGIIALQELVRTGADGYTVMIGNVTTNAIVPILFADRMSLDYVREVVPVMRLVDVPALLVATTKNFPPTTMAEFIAYAKDNPGKVNFATTGVGSYPHYDMVLLAKRAGDLKMTAIPNKGGASGMINDLLVGTTQVSFINVASATGNVKSGMLRPLAAVNHKRLAAFPDVPVMQEVGFDGVGTIAWQGLFASASVPREVLEKIRRATAQALQAPAVIRVLTQQEFNIVPTNSLDEAKEWLRDDMNHWRTITSEIKLDTSN
jgi:tripartite-type tricarboxylate transporter receptor subunit TctC